MNGEDGTSKSSTVGRTSQPALKQCRNATSVRKLLMKLCWWVTHFNFFMFLCFISWFVEELPTFLVLYIRPPSAPSPRHGSSRQLRWGPPRSPGPAAVCGRQSVEVRMISQVFFVERSSPSPRKNEKKFPMFLENLFFCVMCHMCFVLKNRLNIFFSTFLKC